MGSKPGYLLKSFLLYKKDRVTCSGSSLKTEPGFSRIRQKNDLLAPGDSQGRVVAAAEIVSVPVGLVALKCFELPFLLLAQRTKI